MRPYSINSHTVTIAACTAERSKTFRKPFKLVELAVTKIQPIDAEHHTKNSSAVE